MDSFKVFTEYTSEVDYLIHEFNSSQTGVKPRVWSAKKPEIIQTWKNLRPDTPIIVMPIDTTQPGEHSSYGEDGLRITGSWQFIASILGRLKELLAYENPQSKMRLILRGIDKERARADRNSFVFYFNLENRGRGKPGRPQKNKLPTI